MRDLRAELLRQILLEAFCTLGSRRAGSSRARRRARSRAAACAAPAPRSRAPTGPSWRPAQRPRPAAPLASSASKRARMTHLELALLDAASQTSGASSSRRSRLLTAARERPTASAACWWVSSNSLISRSSARASSSGLRSSRWMFSISAIAMAASSRTWRMTAGISCEAGHLRRAPAALAGDDLVALRARRRRRRRPAAPRSAARRPAP